MSAYCTGLRCKVTDTCARHVSNAEPAKAFKVVQFADRMGNCRKFLPLECQTHKWVKRRNGGDPQDPESSAMVIVCHYCGVESED
jgi:hypothetical protein